MLNEQALSNLKNRALSMRRRILHMIHHAGSGHAGPSLSMVEILALLYFRHLRINAIDDPERDYLIVSKGHGAPGYYAALIEAGFLPESEMFRLRRLGSPLQGHPNAGLCPGVEVSTGSLGQGLSIGLGLALGLRLRGRRNRVFCILGDGELQEGQNWEAIMAAASYKAEGLIVIVDRNRLQGDGDTEKVIAMDDLPAKWRAFGWHCEHVDGHEFDALDTALHRIYAARRGVMIAETVKGKGVGYMEGVLEWHHHPINDEQLAQALGDLERNYA